ncbi:thioredoxin domain-containing protein [Alienimonas chondri]|uniref:Thioredoxin domain-containing protein n=1 Tax=Alienimonas chondri TaxID=2681879 RepID=A0ABX1VB22_9PLAN|nr:thioredoxin domain-containing protein [Alienimonas chondri]NNJ24680.1 hypothetical protein [Alienimonas chondri]
MRSGSPHSFLTALAVCAAVACAQGPTAGAGEWLGNLDAGFAAAQRADRPLLVHFSADWCGPCQQMKPILHSRTVTDVLRTDAVGVHLDFDRNKAAAQKYGVRGIPADVLLTPDGRVLGQMSGLKQPDDYARRVRAVAGQYVSLRSLPQPDLGARLAVDSPKSIAKRTPFEDPSFPGLAAPEPKQSDPSLSPAVPDAAFGGAFGDSASDGPSNAGGSAAPRGDTFGDYPDPFGPKPTTDPLAADPPASSGQPSNEREMRRPVVGSPRVARRPSRKLLGMRGFCPVTLHDQRQWVRGARDFQWEHQGITYFLADDAAFDKFYMNADRYAPKLLGCDPVLYRDEGRAVPGSTKHAAIWRDDLFLFQSAETRAKFRADPSAYANGRQVLLIDEIEGIGTY